MVADNHFEPDEEICGGLDATVAVVATGAVVQGFSTGDRVMVLPQPGSQSPSRLSTRGKTGMVLVRHTRRWRHHRQLRSGMIG
jgi:NADPH:quinone reductase-like Zn-dependent oxidoreductase